MIPTYRINLSSFDDISNEIFVPIFENRDRYIFLWGGRDSGKSYSTAEKLIIRCLQEKYFKCILIRKTFEAIKESQYDTIKAIIEEWGIEDLFIFHVAPLEIICKINGNRFIARGLEKADRIKSVRDPSAIWYEEGNQMTEEDFITVTTSVRSEKAAYIQEIFSFNPECDGNYEDFWLFKMFFAKRHPEKSFRDTVRIKLPEGEEMEYSYLVIHSTYLDNPHCPPERYAIYEDLKRTNHYQYIIKTLGEWGNRDVSGRFFKSFDRLVHVNKVDVNLSWPIHISFDENVNPYPALTIWQFNEERKEIYQVHELCLTTPNNKVKVVAREYVSWMRKIDFHDLTFIYGDATSAREDTKLEEGINYFTILKSEIESQGFVCRIRKLDRNPSVALSGEFINSLYENYKGYSIVIGDTNKNSISDYQMVTENTDGSMKKPKNKDGIEIMGHCFAAGTDVLTINGQIPIEDIKVNDLVLTRQGYKKVLWSGCTGNRVVFKYDFGFTQLECTNDHLFWTQKGFKKISSLIGINILCIYNEINKIHEKELLIYENNYYNISKVYDIEVEGMHEFFANNILVHNCSDTKRYFIVTLLQELFRNYQRDIKKYEYNISTIPDRGY
jgi:PBSX family phage terminase large subunit